MTASPTALGAQVWDRLRPDDNEGVDLSPEGLDRVEESRPRHR